MGCEAQTSKARALQPSLLGLLAKIKGRALQPHSHFSNSHGDGGGDMCYTSLQQVIWEVSRGIKGNCHTEKEIQLTMN